MSRLGEPTSLDSRSVYKLGRWDMLAFEESEPLRLRLEDFGPLIWGKDVVLPKGVIGVRGDEGEPGECVVCDSGVVSSSESEALTTVRCCCKSG